MARHVWFSVQSDIGIQMAELGSLSSETDSKLIASTLMALKDIVSIEASSAESAFMTGAVESSAYGTYSVKITEDRKLILSYIISEKAGSVPSESFVDLMQDLCVAFGKQLTQYGEILDLAEAGAGIPHTAIIQSFLNASTILNMERNLKNKPRELREGYKSVMKDFFENPDSIIDAVNGVLGFDWESNPRLWTYTGILKEHNRDKVLNGYSSSILYHLANKQPDLFLYSPNPRGEQSRVLQDLKKDLNNNYLKTEKLIIPALLKYTDKDFNEYTSQVPVNELHILEKSVEREFVRKAILDVVKTKPLVLCALPDMDKIKIEFDKLQTISKFDDAGTFLTQAIVNTSPLTVPKYIKHFYQGFIDEIDDIPLSQTAFDLMIAYSQEFVDTKEMTKQIKNVPGIEKSWTKQLIKQIKSKTIEKLTVESIDEAVLLANSTSNAIISTITETIHDQFFMTSTKVGGVINDMIDKYSTLSPRIKIADILAKILLEIDKIPYSSKLTTFGYKHIVLAYISTNNRKVEIKGVEYTFNSNKNKFQSGKNLYDISQVLVEAGTINLIGDKNLESLDLKVMDPHVFLRYLAKESILYQAMLINVSHKVQELILNPFIKWFDAAIAENENVIVLFEGKKPKDSKIEGIQLELPPYTRLLTNEFGDKVEEILRKNFDILNSNYAGYNDEWLSVKVEIFSKDKLPTKRINKLCRNCQKSLEDAKNRLINDIKVYQQEIEKSFSFIRKTLPSIITAPEGDIMKIDLNSADLVYKKADILSEILYYIQKFDGIQLDDKEELKLGVSLSLFAYPPESVFEPAYNELVTGKRSKLVKKAISKAKNKKDFEKYLITRGETYTAKIYKDFSKVSDRIDNIFMDKNGVVSSDNMHFYLHLGRLPIKKFPTRDIFEELFVMEDIFLIHETSDWLITYDLGSVDSAHSEDPSIVNLSDAVRYLTQKTFEAKAGSVIRGMARVGGMLEAEAEDRIMRLFNTLKRSIFDSMKQSMWV